MSLSGSLKLAWFRTLKSSARNWNCFDSAIDMFLNSEKSQFAYPGPSAILRPALPNCWTGELGSGVIRANAFALSHALAECDPELGSCPATRFGRLAEKPVISGAPPCSDTSLESKTVNGVRLIAVTIPLSCHPPNTCRYQPSACCQKGRLH